MSVKITMNPNFKADVLNAADKKTLEMLSRGEVLSSKWLAYLASKGLIEVGEVTSNSTPPGERDLLYICTTERGKEVLKG